MSEPLHVLMVAAENDGIVNCKVGGIGDVIRDVPPALCAQGCRVSVVTPSYGYLHEAPGAEAAGTVSFRFGGRPESAVLYRVPGRLPSDGVTHYVMHHPAFVSYNHQQDRYEIYCHDQPRRPFATDASKFACFCTAVAEAVRSNLFGPPDVVHLHDWHAAFFLILRKYAAKYTALRTLRTVFTIHNLALQGVRPLTGDSSSLEDWYPDLAFEVRAPADLRDPRWPECVNPMAVGIRLADAVHTVSPSYAAEILQPSRPPHFSGGEGLEYDLQRAAAEQRLHGILNGCEYPARLPPRQTAPGLLSLLKRELSRWAARHPALGFADFIAFQRLDKLAAARKKPDFIAVSVSRIVEQKMLLLQTRGGDGRSGLESILDALDGSGLYILLGSGDRALETFLTETAAARSNFIFLNGYSVPVADALYASGDLFLMPSSFEPCGISQMLAMRSGQPCLVNRTGGLRDTVRPGVDGFGFESASLGGQTDAMAAAFKDALQLHRNNPETWQAVRAAAAAARFLWSDTARQYMEKLYPCE